MKDREEYISILEQDNAELKKQLEELNRFKFSCKKDETRIPATIYSKKTIEDLIKENQELKKKVDERKYYKFYKYENNPCGSDYCFCERPCDSNMNLKCFFENGEICGFMSETLVSNHDNIEEISLNEFAHDFIRPLINANFQNKNQQKAFIKYLEDEIEDCELTSNLIFNHNKEMKIYKEILQRYKEITGTTNE